jgi:hypothetical protein
MKKNSKLILYLLLNIVLSASITLAVLWAWNKRHPQSAENLDIDNLSSYAAQITEQSRKKGEDAHTSPDPSFDFVREDIVVSIHIIVGAGDLDMEYVEIHNQSTGAVDLTGWQLIDEDGYTFTFPALILNADGAIKVLSRTGVNSVIELYWQAQTSIWQSGETATLLNTDGEIITTYLIP